VTLKNFEDSDKDSNKAAHNQQKGMCIWHLKRINLSFLKLILGVLPGNISEQMAVTEPSFSQHAHTADPREKAVEIRKKQKHD